MTLAATLTAALHEAFGTDIDWKEIALVAVTPVFLVAMAIEYRVLRGRGHATPFDWRYAMTNTTLASLYEVAEVIAHILIVSAVSLWVSGHRLFDTPVNGWTILPIFFVLEFLYYWFHRASHRIRWFWSAHVVHHSGEQMDFSTALRQSILHPITGWWLFFLPLVWFGVPPGVVFFLYAVDLFYQFFVHTESVGRLHPWIEYVFNTPSHHRAHHGRNARYIDRNYGGVVILFDRWFGTFEPENEPPDYGILKPLRSTNPFTINLHEFVAMWRDVARPGPIRHRLRHLWAPPEWERPA